MRLGIAARLIQLFWLHLHLTICSLFGSTAGHAVSLSFSDKQNVGPFYGLALGSFAEGEGGLCVECSARVVANINTRNRLGKVDGRYPHWVAPYAAAGPGSGERFSLIYYRTIGGPDSVGPAVFKMPRECLEGAKAAVRTTRGT